MFITSFGEQNITYKCCSNFLIHLYMQDTHQLKNCLFGFLSNMSFTSYEFKDLRQSFIQNHPEFSAKKYYSKIYLIIRELGESGMILVDRKNCTYRYTSNYSKEEILNFVLTDTDMC